MSRFFFGIHLLLGLVWLAALAALCIGIGMVGGEETRIERARGKLRKQCAELVYREQALRAVMEWEGAPSRLQAQVRRMHQRWNAVLAGTAPAGAAPAPATVSRPVAQSPQQAQGVQRAAVVANR